MAVIIDMPKLSDTMTVGTLVSWLKKEGDKVEPGDVIAEVETDKATMELENFEEGILLKQYVSAGAQVPIGAAIAAVGEAGERAPDAPTVAKAEKKADTSSAKEGRQQASKPDEVAVETPEHVRNSSGRVHASPLAKKIAREKGIKLEGLQGTGPDGRIIKADVLSASAEGNVAGASIMPMAKLEGKDIPVSNMRSTIARRLVESKTQVPHFYLEMEMDAAPLLGMRAGLNKYLEGEGVKLTVNDLILKATADALKRVPKVNSSWMGDFIRQHGSIELSFGVAIDDGLVTPVIRSAERKNLREISVAAKELVKKARDRKLKPEEMTGSTFTVTNLGMYGIRNFYGIINTPNAGILSVGATETKPVVGKDGNISIGQRMTIGFSGDHRVVDGATGAEFLQVLKELIETPALILV